MKKDVIRDRRINEIYWDTGIIRPFEELLEKDITFEDAKEKYPKIINMHK